MIYFGLVKNVEIKKTKEGACTALSFVDIHSKVCLGLLLGGKSDQRMILFSIKNRAKQSKPSRFLADIRKNVAFGVKDSKSEWKPIMLFSASPFLR